MKHINLILVDDHQIVRDGIKSLLETAPEINIIGQATDATSLFLLLKTKKPDIILLDISLPDISGIEATKIITKKFPAVKVIMLSMYASEDFIFNALNAGAQGYLPKNTTRKELLLAINQVFIGQEYLNKSIADTILKSYIATTKKDKISPNKTLNTLTLRETEILKYVMEGLKNKEIATNLCISSRTIETHKTNILRKLNLNNTVELVKFAIKNNIIQL